jgi:hypothetical protein
VENDGGEWKAISNGLPESRGTSIAILAANPKNSGEFYAINNRGVFCSTDTGLVERARCIMVQRISFTTSLGTSNSRRRLVVP